MNKFPVFLLFILAGLFACGQDHSFPVSKSDSLKIVAYDQRSGYYQPIKPDSAVYYAELGLKLARKMKFSYGEALMLNRYARINDQYGNLATAVKYQRESLAIFKRANDKPRYTRATGDLGLLEGKSGNIGEGERLLQAALSADLQSHDTAGIIQDYTRLGELDEISGDDKGAINYYSKAEELNHNRPLTEEYYNLLGTLGKLHSKNGNHVQALNLYQQGVSKSRPAGHGKQEVILLRHAARAVDALGNKQQALDLHRQSLQQAQKLNLPDEEARSLMGLASALQERDAEQSIIHLKNALRIAHGIKHKQLASEIYITLSRIYRQQSRFNEALVALEAHHKLVDSLKNRSIGHQLAALQSSYALAESKLHIESLQLVNEKRTAQRNLFLCAAVAILLLLLLFAFYLHRTHRLNRELYNSNQIKDKLFSIIGHDLRNPIGGITQLLAMMESEQLTLEERHEMIIEMRKQGDITLEILNALLNWGESQLKGVHVKNADFNARAIVEKNISALSKQTADKSLLITNGIPATLLLHGDTNHFDFIIRNLISNAIKFSYTSGLIEIFSSTEPGKDQVTISVRDHGKGINADQLARFSGTNMDISFGTSGEKGTGIGLMLSKEFIAANKGRIWIESEEGKGATFNFSFNRADDLSKSNVEP